MGEARRLDSPRLVRVSGPDPGAGSRPHTNSLLSILNHLLRRESTKVTLEPIESSLPNRGRHLFLATSVLLLLSACGRPDASSSPETAPSGNEGITGHSTVGTLGATGTEPGHPGGRLRIAMTEEPRTFNPVTAISNPSLEVMEILHGDLVHFHPRLFEVEPALAESLDISADGSTYRFVLRRDIRFSDGEPFDADDVIFTIEVLLDPEVESIQRDGLLIDGEPVTVRKIDTHTVEATLPTAIADGAHIFDLLPILPEHRLAAPYAEGRIGEVWGIGTDPGELAGLGPFRVRSHEPGQRLVLERNPHYWKRDAEGQPLPYLDEVVISYVADNDAQMLRFLAGETDLVEKLGPDSFEQIRRRDEIEALDLGPGLTYEFLFFNLNDLGPEADPGLVRKQAWFRQAQFRRALSLAIDRRAISRLVYRGLATPVASQVTPANLRWHDPGLETPKVDTEAALELLRGLGFRRDDAEGKLLDPEGEAVTLTLVTNSSNPKRVRTGTVVQEDLRRIGIEVKVVPLDFGALLDRVYDTFEYELCLLGLGRGSTDPSSAMNVWRSDGDSHLWRLQREGAPEPWQIELDDLLDRQRTELDPEARKALYDRAQRLVVDRVPIVFLVAPNVLVGARPDLGNFAPVPVEPVSLWNLEYLYWPKADAR